MIEPNPDSALDAEASRLMQEDWEQYVETAKLWTGVHANKRPACFVGEKEAVKSNAVLQPAAQPKQPHPLNTSCLASATAAKPTTRPAVTTAPKRGLRRL